MNQANVFFAAVVLTLMAFAPAAARADDWDDLDVTMEVVTNSNELDAMISEMEGPDDDGVKDEDWEDEVDGDDSD